MSEKDGGEQFGEPEFLCYRLLVRLKEESDAQITRGKFLKLPCLADEYLQREHNLDIGFPRYWYKYGEITSENDLNDDFYKSGQAVGFSARQYVPSDDIKNIGWEDQQRFGEDNDLYLPFDEIEEDDFNVDEDNRRLINDAVRWVTHKFGTSPVREIRRYQYQTHAPREFIRAYSELRWQLENIEPTQTGLPGQEKVRSRKDIIEDLLDEMVITYPDEFTEMETLFLRWEDTARLLLNNGTDYNQLEKFFESFVESLSKVELRFHFNQNISEERLERWNEEAAQVREEFEVELDEERQGLLLEQPDNAVSEFDKVSEPFDEAVLADLEEIHNEQ